MRSNLAEAKASRIPQAVGIAACDPRFVQLLNDAQARLSEMGKWWGTYRKIRVCVTAGCVTWPREVKTIEAMNVCGRGISIRNDWYEFQEDVQAPSTSCDSCEEEQLLSRGMVSQYRDFTGLSKVRLYATVAADAGKRILVQGFDANGNVIRTLDSVTGDWVDGEYLTLVAPAGFVESTNSFAAPYLTGVQKPLTLGRITATGVNVTDSVETQIAVWSPSEMFPQYRRTFLVNMPNVACHTNECEDQGDGCAPANASCGNLVIEAIVRLDFVPAVVDADWLFIGNLEALRHMMRAIQLEDKELYVQAEREIQLSLRALRNELEAYSPSERTVVNVQPFGTAKPRQIFAGFN